MALIEIPLPNADPSFSFNTELDGKTYYFTFRWNGRIENWVFDLYDSLKEPIQLGNPFISGFALLKQNKSKSKPPGLLYARDMTGSGANATRFNIGRDIKLFYLEDSSG